MRCVTTVSYSIIINEQPTRPFQAKKGQRQGDPLSPYQFVLVMEYLTRLLKTLKRDPNFNYHPKYTISVQLLYQCFQDFSKALGFVANADKSSICFGGVHEDKQHEILQILGFVKGTLPVRYLGVHSVLRDYHWKNSTIKSVLFSIQVFWFYVFLLPKKLIQFIESVCRTFLWTEGVEVSQKALLSWDKLCQPKAAGALNLLDIGKQNSLWSIDPKQASWIVQKVLKAKQYFEEAGCTEEDVEGMRKFSFKTMYVKIRGEFARVSWRKLVCNNAGLPKWIFTVFLAAHRRLLTKDRLRG
ncbi:uncharacterized protein LOC107823861 [Nicotiana tabacum]|uniref:Uncharacterized protein LOC107823861 n=1 Tax=Nicotiana tabacum TaxID=4097 RepID=A0A1S4CY28_TOBAC|nr:PREDICTED: uncharacterized protein LOC107823861 [Nicotiana tabacum]